MSKQLPRGLTQDKKGRYRVQIASRSRPGKSYRERLPEATTRRQAEAHLSRVRELDRVGELLWPSERKQLRLQQGDDRPESFTVRDYARLYYLPYCEARNQPITVDGKRHSLVQSDPWFGGVLLDDIDVALVYKFQAERKAEGVRARTVNFDWGTVRHLLNHAHKMEMRKHPAPKVEKLPENDKKPSRALDEAEATRALQYAHDRSPMWYALTLLLLHTGARWGDVRGLRWQDVDLDNAIVHYRAETAKASRDREVPLVPDVVDALRALPQEFELVFVREHAVNKDEWLALAETARVCAGHRYPWEGEDRDCFFGSHTWRHTFATWKLRSGVSIALVSRWLGHASIQLTCDIYGHIEPGDHMVEMMRGPQPIAQRLRVVGG